MAEPIDFIDSLKRMVDSRLYEVNTSLPAVVVSYSNGRAAVQPTPKRRFADGDVLAFPILQNVRVCWPSFAGGSAGVKGPVMAGDKCLLVFAQQAVDGSDDMRRFDISDAYCLMVDLGSAGAGDSGNNDALTMFYGSGFMRLTSDGALEINAPGGVNITAPSVSNSGTLNNAKPANFPLGASIGGIEFASHRHTGVQSGSQTSGGPVA